MFDISFWEILIILIVAILAIRPEDFPTIMHKIGRFFFHVKQKLKELTGMLDTEEEDANNGKKLIKGDDGELHQSYDLEELTEIINKKDK